MQEICSVGHPNRRIMHGMETRGVTFQVYPGKTHSETPFYRGLGRVEFRSVLTHNIHVRSFRPFRGGFFHVSSVFVGNLTGLTGLFKENGLGSLYSRSRITKDPCLI